MDKLGIRAIVVEGAPEKPDGLYLLLISSEGASLVDAGQYRGMSNYTLAEEIRKQYGDKVTMLSIGPAGENRKTYPRDSPLSALRYDHRTVSVGSMVCAHGSIGPAGDRSGAEWPDHVPSREMDQGVPQLAGEHPGLVHFTPAVVGT